MGDTIRLSITNPDHPWNGHSGILTGKIFTTPTGVQMAEMQLDNGMSAGVTEHDVSTPIGHLFKTTSSQDSAEEILKEVGVEADDIASLLNGVTNDKAVEKHQYQNAPEKRSVDVPEILSSDDGIEKDFKKAREGIYTAINTAAEHLDTIADIAFQSQHPRAYEVLNQYLNTFAKINRDLLDLHKTKKDIEKTEKGRDDENTKTVNNLNVFCGTTSELAEIIKGVKGK